MSHELPNLPYEFDALEPHIDAQTMEIHHDKHHAGYVKKLNAALDGTGLEDADLKEILKNILKDDSEVPEDKRVAVRNNGGGHFNHSLFWEVMGPGKGGEPSGELAEAIKNKFGGFEEFKEQFADTATKVFGSGWAWLALDENKELMVGHSSNQDSPIMYGKIPILGLDVWEHAYYLKYQNKRPDYITAWWNVVDWGKVSELFEKAK